MDRGPRRIKPPFEIQKILVLNHQGIGNVVENVPLLRSLRQSLPKAEIWSTISSPHTRSIIENLGLVDVFYEVPSTSRGARRLRHIASLRPERFDIMIAAPGGSTMASSLWARGLGVGMSLGEADGWSTIGLTHPLDVPYQTGFAEIGRKLAESLGLQPDPSPPELLLSADEEAAAARWIKENFKEGPAPIVFHPGCDAANPFKRWPTERYRELWQIISREIPQSNLLVIGGPDESDLVRQILPRDDNRARGISGNLPIRQLLAVVSQSPLMVSADSGWMHMAAAVGVPRVSIFGPTSVKRCAPESRENEILIVYDCPEAPCYPKACGKDCLVNVEATEVAKAALDLLGGPK